MNKDFNDKINLLLRSQKALVQLEAQKRGRQIVFIAIGFIALLLTLIMLNMTAYFFLVTHFSSIISGLILTSINLAITLLFMLLAYKQNDTTQIKEMTFVRDFAVSQISNDVDDVKEKVNSVFDGSFFSFNGLVPFAITLLKYRRKIR